jgi:DNA polymerase III alpha subunit
MTVRYGLSSVKGIGGPTAAQIVAGQPYASWEDFLVRQIEPKGSSVNRGHLATLVSVGAFDGLVDNRRAVEIQLEREKTGDATRCVNKVDDPNHLEFVDLKQITRHLPCAFDWATENPAPAVMVGRGKNKQVMRKPPPIRCTTACRQYTRPTMVTSADVQPYGEADIRDREKELLGVWLSSTPFDRLDPETRDLCATSDEVEGGSLSVSQGYLVAALVDTIREKTDRNGGRYAFVTLLTETGPLDAICFSKIYAKFRPDLVKDALILCEVWKTDRGLNLTALAPA